MTIALGPEIESRLLATAARRGVGPNELAAILIDEGLAKAEGLPTDALSRWEALTATDDPEEIARRQVEFEEFKAGMNRNRLEMEGPNARKIFP